MKLRNPLSRDPKHAKEKKKNQPFFFLNQHILSNSIVPHFINLVKLYDKMVLNKMISLKRVEVPEYERGF